MRCVRARSSHGSCRRALDDRFGDRQALATAGAFRRACRVDIVRPFEDVREMPRCDASAGIADRQGGHAIGLRRTQRDRATRGCVPKNRGEPTWCCRAPDYQVTLRR